MGGDWRDKAGGLMCIGLSTSSLDDRTRSLLDAGACGVLLRGTAFGEPAQVADLTHAVKRYAARPVFVAVDHELAQARREGLGFTKVPSSSALSDSGDVELARSVGQVLGRELRAVGVDVTLGPAMDVATNREAVLGRERSLGSNPDLVARLSAALVEGQQSEGVAAFAKHFPGHGDTSLDSNEVLPRLPHGMARLEDVELKPFRAAIESRVAGMMAGHILFEALDDRFPASLSRAMIFGLLRQKMSYRGMVMLDDVDMGALSLQYTRAQVAELGVASGADCFLCARRPETAFELIDAIEKGVLSGQVVPERIEAALRRIAPLLHRYVHDVGESPDLSGLGQLTISDMPPLSSRPALSLVPKL